MKSSDFTAKGTSLREYTSFEPFCVKVRWGLTARAEREKSQKVSDSHRNDVSPVIGSRICAFDWHRDRWPWMTLNCITRIIPEFRQIS